MQRRNILAIVDLIYFVPALLISLAVTYRHGFKKQYGWLCLVILAIFRIVGSSLEIAASIRPTNGLVTASIILQSFGLASLLFAIQGFIVRMNNMMTQHPIIPVRVFRLVHLPISAGVALAIVGAVYLGDSETGNNSTGHTLQRAGLLVLVGVFAALAAMALLLFHHRGQLSVGEKPLLMATLASLPLLLIRLIFSILVVFGVDPAVFNITSQAARSVVAEVFMLMLEEFIIVAIFLIAGFAIPVLNRNGGAASGDRMVPSKLDGQEKGQTEERV